MSKDYTGEDFVHLPIPASMLGAVFALLGGVSAVAVATADKAKASAAEPNLAVAAGKPAEIVADAVKPEAVAHVASGEVDTGGHPWSEDLHASTKTKTKEGLWRMKVGVSRPAPLPGFDASATGTAAAAPASNAGNTAPAAGAAPVTDEEDEFAAFTKAANSASAATVARTWSDGDLSKLSNQAAQKLGAERVGEIKNLIGQYVPTGEVPHSRNIPADKREAFAVALEKLAGIEYSAA